MADFIDPNDIDGDGIANHLDTDMDGDGTYNQYDYDVDGDGIYNEDEADYVGAHQDAYFGQGMDAYGDMDGDGVINRNDNDIDGDGVANDVDKDPDNKNVGAQDSAANPAAANSGAANSAAADAAAAQPPAESGGFFQNSMVKNVMTGGTRALGAGLVMKAIRGKPPAPAARPAPAPMMNPMMMRPPMMGPPMGGPPRMNPNMMAQQHAVAAAQARMPGPLTGAIAGFFARRRFK